MTEFEFQGTIDGRPVGGSVKDGKATHPWVAPAVNALIAQKVQVGYGPWSGPATLEDEHLARATIAAVVDDARFTPGAPVEKIPPDAVS